MKETRPLMGMPITVEIVDTKAAAAIDEAFAYFKYVDDTFSTYKTTSEITAINEGRIKPEAYSQDMKTVFRLSEETRQITNGYFNIKKRDGTYDPSGLVKGWAIYNAAKIIKDRGHEDYYVDAGGDVQVSGRNTKGKEWEIGIQDPFGDGKKIVKIIYAQNKGIATSGTYIRGKHIYDPVRGHVSIDEIVSLTVIGPNIYEADRFATAAFAMGADGIYFIEKLPNFEGYMINSEGIATMTSGFNKYTHPRAT